MRADTIKTNIGGPRVGPSLTYSPEVGKVQDQISIKSERHRWSLQAANWLMYVVLLDMAVETWVSQSPLRVWIASSAILYLIALTVLSLKKPESWNRIATGTKIALSIVIFVAIAGISSFNTNGLNHGVAFFGQSTSTGLSLVVAMAIASSAVTIVSWKAVPIAIRTGILLLSIYAIADFVFATVYAQPFAELFAGKGLFSVFPIWLQGAVLGSFFVLPCLFIFLIVWLTLRARKSPVPMRIFVALSLSLALLPPIAAVRPTWESSASELSQFDALDELTGQESAAALASLFDNFEIKRGLIPRDTFDLDAIMATAGSTPREILSWMRKNTALVPYKGMLRGAEGVLMDRRGNSLDRSLLLHAILQHAGFQARIARVSLSKHDAQSIHNAALGISDSMFEVIDQVRTAGAQTDTESVAQIQEMRKSAQSISGRLLDLVENVNDKHGQTSKEYFIGLFSDHWWVQVDSGGEWVDLDPSSPKNRPRWPGQESTFSPEDIPRSLRHSVTVRLALRTPVHGDVTLLEHTIETHSNPLAFFEIYQFPMSLGSITEATLGSLSSTEFTELLRNEIDWLPVLFVNGAARPVPTSRFFSISGDVYDKNDMHPNSTRLGSVIGRSITTVVGSATSMLDNLFGDENNHDDSVGSIEEWLEFTIEGPGYDRQQIERQIASKTSTGALDPLSLYFRTQGVVLPSDLSVNYVADRIAENTIASRKNIERLNTATSVEEFRSAFLGLGSKPGFPEVLAEFGVARRLATDSAKVWLDAPSVFTVATYVRDGGNRPLILRHGVDIVHRSESYWQDSKPVFEERLYQGVFDTILEAQLIGDSNSVQNVALAFASDPDEWLPIFSEESIRSLELDESFKELLRSEVEAGYIAVAPKKMLNGNGTPYFGWWRIDPTSGATLGVDADLRGSAFFEWVVKNWSVTREQVTAFRMFSCVAVGAVTIPLALLEEESMGRHCDTDYLGYAARASRAGAKLGACMIAAGTFGGLPGSQAYVIGRGLGAASMVETGMRLGIRGYMAAGCN